MKKGQGGKLVYRTIRIYDVDHKILIKRFNKSNNFAEIINQLVNSKVRAD